MRFFVLPVTLACLLSGPALAADTRAPEHKITQSESYIMLEPMYATIIDQDKPTGTLMVAIGLDIPDRTLRNDANRAMPILRDAYIRSMMAYAWSHVRIWVQPDVEEISARLQRVTDHELHRTGARVLLAEVVIRVTR